MLVTGFGVVSPARCGGNRHTNAPPLFAAAATHPLGLTERSLIEGTLFGYPASAGRRPPTVVARDRLASSGQSLTKSSLPPAAIVLPSELTATERAGPVGT